MKILHTSDWHLGKRLDDFSRFEEQQAVLNEICDIAEREKADAAVIAGDLFDTFNPPAEAVDLFYKILKRLSDNGRRPVIAIAGNHDSPDRIEAPDPLARECGIIFAGYPGSSVAPFALDSGLEVLTTEPGFLEIKLPASDIPLRILLTPYASEYRLRTFLGNEGSDEELPAALQRRWTTLADQHCDDRGINILAAHLFMVREGDDFPEEPDDEKPILHAGGSPAIFTHLIPPQIQYTALGHLHRKQQVDHLPSPVCYSGSPLSYSFAEANQRKFCLITEIEPGTPSIVREIELTCGKKLLRKRAEGMADALSWLAGHTDSLVELTLVTDTFLTANERRQLASAHPGIVSIIPEVINAPDLLGGRQNAIDLSKPMEELFRDYFLREKGQQPNDEIMNLFTEMLAEEEL